MTHPARGTRLTDTAYLTHLQQESAALREAVAVTVPGTMVPTCPKWTVDDLAWHLGGEAFDFWIHVIAHRPEPPVDYEDPVRPAERSALLAYLDERTATLIETLRAAEGSDPAWSWTNDQTVGFTTRRQTLEALVHRVDAELASGRLGPIDADLAADGVVEVLDIFFGAQPPWATFTPGGVVAVEIDDANLTVRCEVGRLTGVHPRSGEEVDEAHLRVLPDEGPYEAALAGRAEDLLLYAWGRRDDAALREGGDPAVLRRFRAVLAQPIEV